MTYILILFLTYVLHLLLKLNWVCTAVVLVFLLVFVFEGAEDNPCI